MTTLCRDATTTSSRASPMKSATTGEAQIRPPPGTSAAHATLPSGCQTTSRPSRGHDDLPHAVTVQIHCGGRAEPRLLIAVGERPQEDRRLHGRLPAGGRTSRRRDTAAARERVAGDAGRAAVSAVAHLAVPRVDRAITTARARRGELAEEALRPEPSRHHHAERIGTGLERHPALQAGTGRPLHAECRALAIRPRSGAAGAATAGDRERPAGDLDDVDVERHAPRHEPIAADEEAADRARLQLRPLTCRRRDDGEQKQGRDDNRAAGDRRRHTAS